MTVEIALLHRVLPEGAPLGRPDTASTVTPQRLDRFLSERHDWERPAPDELPTQAPERSAVMLTVDHGFANFEEHVLPVMERHGVHCVLFVVSDWAMGVRGPYEMALARALEQREQVEIPLQGVVDLDSATARALAYDGLRRLYKQLPTAEREALVEELGGDVAAVEPGTFLSPERVRALSRHPLVTIGAQTCTHPFLPRLRAERLAAEIAGSKRRIETWIGARAEWFSYPYGGYNRAVRRCVAAAGFRFACGSVPGAFEPRHVDALALPRTDLAVVRAEVRA